MPTYPRDQYSAYPEIVVNRHTDAFGGVRWIARIYSYDPVGYLWQGNILDRWPDNLPIPIYPEFPHNGTRQQIAQWREECNQISNANPAAYHLLAEISGAVEFIDLDEAEREARRLSASWVDEQMKNYRRL